MVSVFHHLVYLFLLVCVCTAVCVPMEDRRACPFDAGAACGCKMPDVGNESRTGGLYERNNCS